ncbi:MAG TPA: T9SS type A sorting domain-containing protein [Saprospiraceae bacterium]|nr:T9SS type A sorting domain-containing protein [Saprospiraceae bacterium]
MKYYLFTVVCFIFLYPSPGIGQDNFLDSTYTWTESQLTMSGETYTFRYTFSAEPTEIDGLVYYERLRSLEPNGNNWEQTGIFYRSDISGKVFVNQYHQEYPVYDYNLSVNDSLAIGDLGIYLVVASIDSVTLENGERRKQLAMRCSFDTDPDHGWGYRYWIEGIGGTNGVQNLYFNDCIPDGGGTSTLCVSRNDTLLYDNPDSDSCWYTTVSTIPVKEDKVVIFPNPTSGVLQISGVSDPIEVIIRNVTGSFVSKQSGYSVDLANEPPGVYFISLKLRGSYRHYIKPVVKI